MSLENFEEHEKKVNNALRCLDEKNVKNIASMITQKHYNELKNFTTQDEYNAKICEFVQKIDNTYAGYAILIGVGLVSAIVSGSIVYFFSRCSKNSLRENIPRM